MQWNSNDTPEVELSTVEIKIVSLQIKKIMDKNIEKGNNGNLLQHREEFEYENVAVMTMLFQAMCFVENGENMDYNDIYEGYMLAK
jgi:hypothetical protein